MLKTTVSSQVLIANKVLAANEVGGFEGGDKLIEKCRKSLKTGKLLKDLKLSKSGNLKGKKLAKFKKPSKSENSSNFNAKETSPNFLIPEARAAFNRLQLVFIKALIFQHFASECQIQIEINASSYAIGSVLSHLASKTRPDGSSLRSI